MEIAKIAISVLTIIIFTVTWKILNWLWLNPRKKERILRQQGFKGNPYTFRRLLFGDVNESEKVYEEAYTKPIKMHDPVVPRAVPFIHITLKKYGNKSFVWAGQRPKVLIMEPELMKTILVKHNNFIKNFKVTNNIVQDLITGIIRTEHDEWAKRRGILNPPFQMEKLKQMIPIYQKCSNDFVNEWKELVSKDVSCTVDVFPYLETLIARITSESLFATDYSKDIILYDLIKENAALARQASRIADLPGSKYLPTEKNRKAKKISREIRQILRALISERQQAIKEGKISEDNLFNMLLGSELAHGYGEDEILGHLKGFFFNGHDTIAVLLVWCLILLGKYQDWQERARKEAFKVFEKRQAEYAGLSQLKVLSMIVNEVLRLYPPVVELSRLVEGEIQLGEYTIPADTQVMLPLVVIHRDPEYWGEDADEFNPDRFSEGVVKATKGRPIYFPFSWGPRACIGQNFAFLSTKLVLVDILRTFSFEISPTYIHATHVIFTLQPQFGAPLIIRNLK